MPCPSYWKVNKCNVSHPSVAPHLPACDLSDTGDASWDDLVAKRAALLEHLWWPETWDLSRLREASSAFPRLRSLGLDVLGRSEATTLRLLAELRLERLFIDNDRVADEEQPEGESMSPAARWDELRVLQAPIRLVHLMTGSSLSAFDGLTALSLHSCSPAPLQDILELLASGVPSLTFLSFLANVSESNAAVDWSRVRCRESLKRVGMHLRMEKSTSKQPICVRFNGELAALTHFSVGVKGKVKVKTIALDEASLVEMLAPAHLLRHLELRVPRAWELASILSFRLDVLSNGTLKWFTVADPDADAGSAWEACERLVQANVPIDSSSVMPLVTDADRLASILPLSRKFKHIALSSGRYNDRRYEFLLRPAASSSTSVDLPLLAAGAFASVRTLNIFPGDALTELLLSNLVSGLPHLQSLTVTNNAVENMSHLALKSASLRSLCLTHFHRLKTFCLRLPQLEYLELDNCDDSTLSEGISEFVNNGLSFAYESFSERFLRRLLGSAHPVPPAVASLFPPDLAESEVVDLPSLTYVRLWHNSNPCSTRFDFRRDAGVSVDCTIGHPTLETLSTYNLAHFRNIALRNLPRLRKLWMGSSLTSGPEEVEIWTEEEGIRMVRREEVTRPRLEIPDECEVFVNLPFVRREDDEMKV